MATDLTDAIWLALGAAVGVMRLLRRLRRRVYVTDSPVGGAGFWSLNATD